MVIGYALPGMAEYLHLESYEPTEELEIPEYVEVTANVTEFELEFTTTILTTGLLEDLEEEDLNEIEDMVDSMEDLKKASGELVEGTTELYDGMEEFQGYLEDFAEGADILHDGTKGLRDGLEVMEEKKVDLAAGVTELNMGLKLLYDSLSTTLPSVEETEEGEENTVESSPGARASEENNGDTAETPSAAEADLLKTLNELGLEETDQEKILEGVQAVLAEQMSVSMGAVQSNIGELQAGGKLLAEGVAILSEGIGELYKGAEKLSEGTAELSDVTEELSEGFTEVVDGVKELKDGFAEFDREGIRELEKLAGSELQKIVERLRSLKEVEGNWSGFSDAFEKGESVRIILETAEIKN